MEDPSSTASDVVEAARPPLPPAPDVRCATPEMFQHLRADSFQAIPGYGAEIRDLPLITQVSGGSAGGRLLRARPGARPDELAAASNWHMNHTQLQIAYVTKGWAVYEYEGLGEVRVEEGTLICMPGGVRQRMIEISADYEDIEIEYPVCSGSTWYVYDEGSSSYAVHEQVYET